MDRWIMDSRDAVRCDDDDDDDEREREWDYCGVEVEQ